MMTKLAFGIFLCLVTSRMAAQDFTLGKLTAKNKKERVRSVYNYVSPPHGRGELLLYQNGTFYYRHSVAMQNEDVFSRGTWFKKGDTLVLDNAIKIGQIPIQLSYSMDSSQLLDGFRVGVVKNLKGEEMPDGLVAINRDSNICLPSYGGMCREEYKSIDSIKVVFENGLSSGWLKIADRPFVLVTPIVQTNFLLSNYLVYDQKKFLFDKTSLKRLD